VILVIKIGIRAHDLGRYHAALLAEKVNQYGFEGIQLVFKKALETFDSKMLDEIKVLFPHQIWMLGAYFNPIDPNGHNVEKGIINFKEHLEMAKKLDVTYVGTETGSLMGTPWGYVPENHQVSSLETVIKVFEELVEHAKITGRVVALEGAYQHVAYDPLRVKIMVDRLNSKHLKVTLDLYNFLNIDNHHLRNDIWDQAIHLLKSEIVIVHLKDYVVKDNTLKQVGLGQGLMDYPYIIKTIKASLPHAYLIFEGVMGDDIETSLMYIKKLLGE
jgi:sugar phosphate isomerase/epimerase